MKLVIALTTTLSALLGMLMGYAAAGIGGAVLYAALIGLGGRIFGALAVRTIALLHPSWKAVLATAMLLAITVITWGMRL